MITIYDYMSHLFHRIFSIVPVIVNNVFHHFDAVNDKIPIQEVVCEEYLRDRRREIQDFAKYKLGGPESVGPHIGHNLFPNFL